MTADAAPVRNGALWFALLGGPVAWTIHLLSSYPLVSLACRLQTTMPLNLITAATATLSAAACLTGALAWRRLRPADARRAEGDSAAGNAGAAGDGAESERRARFMAGAGAVLGLFFVYVIIVEGLPPLLQDPCIEVM